tara:strand:+ start:202 stop:369 length:168 start_codon:yes stop_codon:yes gene_type:complete
MKNLWTKRNIMDYLSHPEESLDKNYTLFVRNIEKSLEGWMKRPKKMEELLIGIIF